MWHREFLKMSAKLGNVFAFYLGSRYVVVLNGKEAIHDALIKHSLKFSDRPQYYTNTDVLNIHAKGFLEHHYNAEFCRQRKLSLSILKQFGFGKNIMEERIHTEVSVLLQQIQDVKSVAFCPDAVLMTRVLSVITSILFGHHMEDTAVGELGKTASDFLRTNGDFIVAEIFALLRFLPKMRRTFSTLVALNNQFFHMITNYIETAEEDSFVRYYMNREGCNLDREQLEFIVRDFVLAGSETVTSTLQWALLLLAGRDGQCVQECLWKEIDAQVPRERLPSLTDHPHIPFVEATILEVMRVRTVAPLALAHRTSCDTSVGGYFIPANTMIIPNLYSVHMDPKVWEQPEQFRPERFLDEFGNIVGKELIMPFSIGRRSCLGELLAQQEIYLFLAAVVQNFIIKPPEGCDEVVFDERVGITTAPEHYTVRFLPRSRE